MEATIYVVYECHCDEVQDICNEIIDAETIVNKYFTDLKTAEACRDYYNAKMDNAWSGAHYRIATLHNGNFIDYNSFKEKAVLERRQIEATKAEHRKQMELEQLAILKAKYEC